MYTLDTQATAQTAQAAQAAQAAQLAKPDRSLQDLVYNLVNRFLVENKSKSIADLYDMILSEVEPPLLQAVMEKKRGNQLQAARLLGISRGTIRKKLQRYFGTKYFRLTEDE